MNDSELLEEYGLLPRLIEQIACEVSKIIAKRLTGKEVLRLCQIIFIDVDEAAELLRVKPKTISTWISQGKIPVRYAGGRPVFLLSELMDWTLPEGDTHASHRLSVTRECIIAANRLATNRERRFSDAG